MKLIGTTKRLRQLIRSHGSTGWRVLRGPEPVACFNNEPGVFVESPTGTHTRWVRPSDLTEESKA